MEHRGAETPDGPGPSVPAVGDQPAGATGDDSLLPDGARRYRSTVRAERAQQTRRRIAEAAGDLFATTGFAGTTVAAIAERAGVTAQTVYATFGSKGAIVRSLLTQFEGVAEADIWAARIAAETDPSAKLSAFATWTARLLASSRPVIEAARGAAADPALIELRRQGDQQRRAGLTSLMADLAALHALRPDLTVADCVDRAWLMTGLEVYLAAADGCGWSEQQYADWLAETLASQVLRQPADVN